MSRQADSSKKSGRETFGLPAYLAFGLVTLFVFLLCVSVGSVSIPVKDTAGILIHALLGKAVPENAQTSILLSSRLPRVICVALTGASLAVGGASPPGRHPRLQQAGRKEGKSRCGRAWRVRK